MDLTERRATEILKPTLIGGINGRNQDGLTKYKSDFEQRRQILSVQPSHSPFNVNSEQLHRNLALGMTVLKSTITQKRRSYEEYPGIFDMSINDSGRAYENLEVKQFEFQTSQ